MKKFMALLMVVILSFSMAACSGGKDIEKAEEVAMDFLAALEKDSAYEKYLTDDGKEAVEKYLEKVEKESEDLFGGLELSSREKEKYTEEIRSYGETKIEKSEKDGKEIVVNFVRTFPDLKGINDNKVAEALGLKTERDRIDKLYGGSAEAYAYSSQEEFNQKFLRYILDNLDVVVEKLGDKTAEKEGKFTLIKEDGEWKINDMEYDG